MVTIIEKLELGEDNNQKSTPIGYTANIDLINDINEQYDLKLGAFVGANRTKLENGMESINTFFETTTHVHEARISTESVEGLELNEITNINQL